MDYDARLYISQILLVLTSSSSASSQWCGPEGFHLVGYSLGGGLSVAFARYLPHLVRSLGLVAPCGLIRRDVHVGWRSRLLYDSFVGRCLIPGPLLRYLVGRRIRPPLPTPTPTAVKAEPAEAEIVDDGDAAGTETEAKDGEKRSQKVPRTGNSDASGGESFDGALVSLRRGPGSSGGATVSAVVRWQVDQHAGFVGAFLSTIRCAPIYAPQGDWAALSALLAARRQTPSDPEPTASGLRRGRVHVILGEDDPVIAVHETMEDAQAVLGPDGVKLTVFPGGGHEIPMTRSAEIADALVGFWNAGT